MSEVRRPMPGPGRVDPPQEVVGRQENFTFGGRVRMAWRLLRGQPVFGGFADPLFLFGGAETLSQDGHLVVETWQTGGTIWVSAVRFRGVQLPFVERDIDAEHHEANVAYGDDLPQISGVVFIDE